MATGESSLEPFLSHLANAEASERASHSPHSSVLRFIEVKGRVTGATTITVTRNEILYSLNKPEDFILAIVEFDGDEHRVYYIRQPFRREPDFGVTSVNYDFADLLARSTPPT